MVSKKRMFYGQADRKSGKSPPLAWPEAFVKVLSLFPLEYDFLIVKMDFT